MTRPTTGRTILMGFVAGALGVPFGHQLMLGLFNLAGVTTRTAFDMAPTPPLGVPSWISATFWGGLWGIVLALVLARCATARGYWTVAALFGVCPSVVTWTLVPLLKGEPFFFGGNHLMMIGSIVVNMAWSLVAAAVLWITLRRTAGDGARGAAAA